MFRSEKKTDGYYAFRFVKSDAPGDDDAFVIGGQTLRDYIGTVRVRGMVSTGRNLQGFLDTTRPAYIDPEAILECSVPLRLWHNLRAWVLSEGKPLNEETRISPQSAFTFDIIPISSYIGGGPDPVTTVTESQFFAFIQSRGNPLDRASLCQEIATVIANNRRSMRLDPSLVQRFAEWRHATRMEENAQADYASREKARQERREAGLHAEVARLRSITTALSGWIPGTPMTGDEAAELILASTPAGPKDRWATVERGSNVADTVRQVVDESGLILGSSEETAEPSKTPVRRKTQENLDDETFRRLGSGLGYTRLRNGDGTDRIAFSWLAQPPMKDRNTIIIVGGTDDGYDQIVTGEDQSKTLYPTFDIMEYAEAIDVNDPETGEDLGRLNWKIGECQVYFVAGRHRLARITEEPRHGRASLKPGQVVVFTTKQAKKTWL